MIRRSSGYLSAVDVKDYASTFPEASRVADAETRAVYREACRIRARYAAWFGRFPHARYSPRAAPWFNGTRSLAYPFADAMRNARATRTAGRVGLRFETEDCDHAWDGDCPAPPVHLDAIVRDERGRVLASLGSIGLDSADDPYLDTVAADLFAEAIEAIAVERDAEATREAESLAARATYAGPSEVRA